MDDLTGFQRDILVILAGFEEPYGLVIKDELEDYYETEINHGRLYPNLDTLVEKGFVEKDKQDNRTNVYTLTDSGRATLADRHEWEDGYVMATDAVSL